MSETWHAKEDDPVPLGHPFFPCPWYCPWLLVLQAGHDNTIYDMLRFMSQVNGKQHNLRVPMSFAELTTAELHDAETHSGRPAPQSVAVTIGPINVSGVDIGVLYGPESFGRDIYEWIQNNGIVLMVMLCSPRVYHSLLCLPTLSFHGEVDPIVQKLIVKRLMEFHDAFQQNISTRANLILGFREYLREVNVPYPNLHSTQIDGGRHGMALLQFCIEQGDQPLMLPGEPTQYYLKLKMSAKQARLGSRPPKNTLVLDIPEAPFTPVLEDPNAQFRRSKFTLNCRVRFEKKDGTLSTRSTPRSQRDGVNNEVHVNQQGPVPFPQEWKPGADACVTAAEWVACGAGDEIAHMPSGDCSHAAAGSAAAT